MSILTKPLPDCVIWQGRAYRINTDFRIWLEFERIMQDLSIPPHVKAGMICNLCFEEPPPYGAALDALMEFCVGEKPKGAKGGKAILSFEQDAEYIYAAFYAQYGIDLTEIKMHWHKFKALFAGLKEDNMIVKIMQFRSADISKIKDKNQKAFYKKMKRLYRIKNEAADAAEGFESLFREVDR